MKKLITLLLVLTMVLSMAACASNETDNKDNETTENTTDATENVTDDNAVSGTGAVDILTKVWDLYPEDEKFFVSGGNMEYHIEQMEKDENYLPPNAPGVYDLAYAENLPYVLYIPEAELANIDEAATMVHGMLANNFTSGVVHVKAGTDVTAMAGAIKDNLAQTQWICGTPDQMLVAVVGGEYVLLAFGVNDAMNPFVARFGEAYPDADVIYSGSIIG